MNTSHSGKVVPIRPDSQQTILSGNHPKGSIADQSGYNGDASQYHQTSTNKLNTQHNMFESDEDHHSDGELPMNFRGTLERPLTNQARKVDKSLKMIKSSKKNGPRHGEADSSIQFSSEDGENFKNKKRRAASDDEDSVDSEHRREKEDEQENQEMWDELNDQDPQSIIQSQAKTLGNIENVKEQR